MRILSHSKIVEIMDWMIEHMPDCTIKDYWEQLDIENDEWMLKFENAVMNKKSGIIYKFEGEERWGLAYDHEQHADFIKMGKRYVQVFTDHLCTKPEMVQGMTNKILKDNSKLKLVGFSD